MELRVSPTSYVTSSYKQSIVCYCSAEIGHGRINKRHLTMVTLTFPTLLFGTVAPTSFPPLVPLPPSLWVRAWIQIVTNLASGLRFLRKLRLFNVFCTVSDLLRGWALPFTQLHSAQTSKFHLNVRNRWKCWLYVSDETSWMTAVIRSGSWQDQVCRCVIGPTPKTTVRFFAIL